MMVDLVCETEKVDVDVRCYVRLTRQMWSVR